ncbi:MAG: flavin reductase family protein [Sphingopyxis sp.]|uniref:flavin reductase family protein n=1 Tax=Sphingopyxis sp. TaxID=1908224 RepID=UPI003D6C9689
MTGLRADFLDGMSRAAATVNIITTDGPAGRAGLTVSAMTSVSADTPKPTLLICINATSAGAAPIIENGAFAVNVLSESQSGVSDVFAGRSAHSGEARFGCATWQRGVTGAPLLDGALVSFDCRVAQHRQIGTHHVLFGEVEAVRFSGEGRPLIYALRSYAVPAELLG